MGTKSKSKYLYFIAFVVCVYMFGLSVLSASDFIKNRSYLRTDAYFTSTDFKEGLVGYFGNIQALDNIYKDFSQKSVDEKVTYQELMLSKTVYDSNLRKKEFNINIKYNTLATENEGNKEVVNSIIETKNKELDQLKKENTKTLEDMKKEIAEYKTKDYETIKSALNEKSFIKYYIIRGKNNVIDTNIANVSDIDLYVKDNAMYSIKFPEQIIMNFAETYKKGYFIIPKNIDRNSYIYKNYIYYNSVGQRIIKEAIIGSVSFFIGFIMLIYILKKRDKEIYFIKNTNIRYHKVPLDLWIFIFIIYSLSINSYINKVGFFYKPYDFGQIYKLTQITFYIYYFILSVRMVVNLIRHKEEFRVELKNCLIYRLISTIKDKSIAKRTKFKVISIIMLTLLLGVAAIGVAIIGVTTPIAANDRAVDPNIVKILLMISKISLIYILCYMIIMLFYIFKINGFLYKLIKGTEEIVSGNLNYTIEEKGRGDLFKLAHNINNMKASFKKSLENEIKSERLKSELITNVSHDLKTPLTSIINYVDLLKKEGISKEEAQGYIEVLDRKSQRLKMLIDDLFEASKMASGAVELNIEKVDVTALLQQSLAELDEKINNSSLIFKLNVPKEKVYANLDGKKTWRVFENLINNILKYALPKTRVYIDLVEANSKITITMKNISSYEMDFDKEEIFERFKRGDKSRNTEGSGLGLSIAKSILELQGGNLSIGIDGDLFKAEVTVSSFPS